MTAVLKSKQTSIATVRKHLRTEASLLTPLPFHYPLPLRFARSIVFLRHRIIFPERKVQNFRKNVLVIFV